MSGQTPLLAQRWVDFRAVKGAVTIEMVLEHYVLVIKTSPRMKSRSFE